MKRYLPRVLDAMSHLDNSWFKFVISADLWKEQWQEIREEYLDIQLIRRNQVILMPQGATREELISNQQAVVELAIKAGVRYSSREHIMLWDKKVGI